MKSLKSYFYRAAEKADVVNLNTLLIRTVAYTYDATPEEKTVKVRALLEAGASPDAMQRKSLSELRSDSYAMCVDGEPPAPYRHALGLALENGLTGAVKLLLKAGADVSTLNYPDMEPNAGVDIVLAHMAANNLLDRHKDIADMLRRRSEKFLEMQKPAAPGFTAK